VVDWLSPSSKAAARAQGCARLDRDERALCAAAATHDWRSITVALADLQMLTLKMWP
jgi:hypothetical protein